MNTEESLTPEDLQFFEDNGYVILHDAVPKENIVAAIDAIWDFLGMDRKNSKDWYRPPATRIGFVELYHCQAFWNNRSHPRVYNAFVQLWKNHKLWVSIDRACMKVPTSSDYPDYLHRGFVHWDLDPWSSDLPFGLQGVLCLEDTPENCGGFHCVPGLHKTLSEWIKTVEPPVTSIEKFHSLGIPINVPENALKTLKVKQIDAKAGDLIIWRRELAHGNGQNFSDRPRLAQYINMFPERYYETRVLTPQECLHPETRHQRIEGWKNNQAPHHKPGDKTSKKRDYQKPELSELGVKLLGLENW